MTNDTWGLIKAELATRVGNNNYVTWIEPLRMRGLEAGVAHFDVPTSFFANWVQRNFSEQILGHLNSRGHEVSRVEFSVLTPAHPISGATRTHSAVNRPASRTGRLRSAASDEPLPGAALDGRAHQVERSGDAGHDSADFGAPFHLQPVWAIIAETGDIEILVEISLEFGTLHDG